MITDVLYIALTNNNLKYWIFGVCLAGILLAGHAIIKRLPKKK